MFYPQKKQGEEIHGAGTSCLMPVIDKEVPEVLGCQLFDPTECTLENWDQENGSPLFFPLLFCQVWQWKLHENKSGPIFFFPLTSLVSHGNQSRLREKEGSESFLCLPMELMTKVLLFPITG